MRDWMMYLGTLVILVILGCIPSQPKPEVKEETRSYDSVLLKVTRGAFHYDTFVLQDTTLTFYPDAHTNPSSEAIPYTTVSKKEISVQTRDRFINEIIAKGIWDLHSEYKAQSSCTSGLTITFSLHGKSKTIVCDDFERECPEILQYIENEIIRLHGQNLKRIWLPG